MATYAMSGGATGIGAGSLPNVCCARCASFAASTAKAMSPFPGGLPVTSLAWALF